MRPNSKLHLLPLALAVLASVPSTQASQWNKLTRLDINETIRVPGATLPPGEYVVKLADSPSNRHIVRFFNGDQTKVIATVLAVPNRRMRPTGETQLSFYETPAGQPPALRAWFYPGDTFGQEFVYSQNEARAIARTADRNVPAMDDAQGTKLQGQTAAADAEPPLVLVRETRVYTWSPRGAEVAGEAGAVENEKKDQDPAWRSTQKANQRYGRFGAMSSGTSADGKKR